MSRSLGTLTLDLVAKTAGFTQGMDKAGRQSAKFRKQIDKDIKAAKNAFVGLAGVIGAGAAWSKLIKNTIAQEKAVSQLEATLRSTGRYTPELSANLQKFAGDLQGITTYGDEAVISSQALLLTFTKIGNEQFPRAQQAILDVATAMGTDLKTATLQVGKALNDPVLGMTALSRSGIQFTEEQKEVVKQLVDTGRSAEAQSVILKELETQFGGSAVAARDTLGGALQSLQNAFGDLFEAKGGLGDTKGAIEDLTSILSDPATVQGINNLTSAMITGFGEAVRLLALIPNSIEKIAEWWYEDESLILSVADAQTKLNEARAKYNLMPLGSEARAEAEKEVRWLERRLKLEQDIAASSGGGGQPAAIGAGVNVPVLSSGGGATSDIGISEEENLRRIREFEEELRKQDEADKIRHEWKLESVAAEMAQREELENARLEFLRRIRSEEEAQIAAETGVLESLRTEQENIVAMYEERANIILNSTRMMEEEKTRIIMELAQQRDEQLAQIERDRTSATLTAYQGLFDGIAGLSEAFAGKQSGIYRAMFGISKAFAIADATLKVTQAIANASASGPFPANIAAMASVASATGGLLAQIQGTQLSFEGGGFTGYGPRSGGIDGKGGFPAIVHPNETIIDHTKGQQAGANIRVVNVLDPSVVGDYLGTDAGEELIMNVVSRNRGSM